MNTFHESLVQSAIARALAAALSAQGFVVAEGEYDLRRTVEVTGAEGRRLVVVPLHLFVEDEPNAREAGEWALMVRSRDGLLLDAPDVVDVWDAPFGCPSVWDVADLGQDVEAGVAWTLDVLEPAAAHGFVPASGVRPGTPATAYPQAPYPGKRPAGSWVADAEALLWPVMPDSAAGSGWSVVASVQGDAVCLDAWLDSHGVAGLDARVPVLSYGSNANPDKFVDNGVSLPGVNLQARVHDLASVYCAGTRGRDGAVTATVASLPGHTEDHVVAYVLPGDFSRLDDVEGRGSRWYDLVALTSGRVVLTDGTEPKQVMAYVGGRRERFPLLTAAGEMLLVSDTTQTQAHAELRSVTSVPEPAALGNVWPLGVGVVPEVPAVFVYGTLMPSEFRWPSLAPYAVGEPEPAHVPGSMHDTGHGFPALFTGHDVVPGFLVRLAPETRDEALAVLDAIEGTSSGLFTREVVVVDGTVAWVYRGSRPSLRGTPIAAWPVHA